MLVHLALIQSGGCSRVNRMLKVVVSAVFAFGLSAGPGWAAAGEPVRPGDPGRPYEQDLDSILEAMQDLLRAGTQEWRDHVEAEGQFSPGSPDEDAWGRLQLKLYPNGRRDAEGAVGVDGWFRFSPIPHAEQFAFQFRVFKVAPPATFPDSVL